MNKKTFFIIAGIILLIGGIATAAFFITQANNASNEQVTVQRGDIVQEVSASGSVEAKQSVELAFEKSGKISAVHVGVGKQVSVGQTLLTLDTNDLQIKLNNQRLALEKAKLILSKVEPKTNAEDDLKKAYEDGFNTVSNAFLDLPTIISGLDDILNSWRHSPYLSDQELRFIGDTAREYHDTVARAYYATDENFDKLLKRYKVFTRNSSPEELESMLNDTYTLSKQFSDTIKDTHNLVDYVENKKDESQREPEIDRDQAVLDTYTEEVNTHLAELLKIKDIIKYSREGITDNTFDISNTRINIQQAELDIQDTLNQIDNREIKSPINGIITEVNAKVGEIVGQDKIVVSLATGGALQIKLNVVEDNIVNVRVGQEARITFDSIDKEEFLGKVVAIDPAETIIGGAVYYQTTILFEKKDELIRSGMTANVWIKTAVSKNALSVPASAVQNKNGKKIVLVLKGEEIVEKEVETGIKNDIGMIEITSGLSEGEQIILGNMQ